MYTKKYSLLAFKQTQRHKKRNYSNNSKIFSGKELIKRKKKLIHVNQDSRSGRLFEEE